MAKKIVQTTVTVKEFISPSVFVEKGGKKIKLPSNVDKPAIGDEITVNDDWYVDPKSPDAAKPVPVPSEGLTTDDIGKAQAAAT